MVLMEPERRWVRLLVVVTRAMVPLTMILLLAQGSSSMPSALQRASVIIVGASASSSASEIAVAPAIGDGGDPLSNDKLFAAPLPRSSLAMTSNVSTSSGDTHSLLDPKQLIAWQALFDMMKGSDGDKGGSGGGGCVGTCTSRDDPCSCSYTKHVRCSVDGAALTYLNVSKCHVTGIFCTSTVLYCFSRSCFTSFYEC